ncbi:MAG TPA: ABC transporter substrate-binding protein [Ktedonobacteraceae bacterium]|jgi:ABC-type branched-subunit amino acid transport system substrate-binding protein
MQQFKEKQQKLKSIRDYHKNLLLRMEQPEEIDIQDVYSFLEELARGGSTIEDAENRALLQELIRYWSSIINDKTGDFPVIQLQPFDQSLIHSRTTGQILQSRWWMVILILIVVMLLSSGGYTAFLYFHSSPTSIGVTQIGNESIGISDGSYAFDTTLADGSLKSQAAQMYRQNSTNVNQVTSLLNQATAINSNDAEALIYQEDLNVVNSGNPYVTMVVATILSGANLGVGRDDLQGAYVAQKEFNDGSKLHGGVQVRLLIANTGSKPDYVSNITQQIIHVAQTDKTFVGVMGWPFSAYTLAAIKALRTAKIPLISPADSSDELTNASPYFFRVVPSDNQSARLGAQYAIGTLHAKSVALFEDPQNPFSSSLAGDFLQDFVQDGGQLAVEELYTAGKPETLPSQLQDALSKSPDLIYFSGYASDANILLSNQLPPNLPVLGGNALYDPEVYSAIARTSSFTHLHFTADAYPDEWNILGYSDQEPAFFSEYQTYFDPHKRYLSGTYGFTRPDSGVMVAYDATLAMLSGCNMVLSSGKQFVTPEDLELELRNLNGANAIQGVSGQIAFGPDGNPINKAVLLLYVDSQGAIYMYPTILGQFIKQ